MLRQKRPKLLALDEFLCVASNVMSDKRPETICLPNGVLVAVFGDLDNIRNTFRNQLCSYSSPVKAGETELRQRSDMVRVREDVEPEVTEIHIHVPIEHDHF